MTKKKQKYDKIKSKRNEAKYVEKQAFISIFGDHFPPLTSENKSKPEVDNQTQDQLKNIEERIIENVLSHIDKKLQEFEKRISEKLEKIIQAMGESTGTPESLCQDNQLGDVEERLKYQISGMMDKKLEQINKTLSDINSKQSHQSHFNKKK